MKHLRLLLLLPIALLLVWCASPTIHPEPDPDRPRETQGQSAPGTSALGQIALSVPNTVGTTTSWTAGSLVNITSASVNAFVAGDKISIWGSSTGTETTAPAYGFIASSFYSGTALSWSASPSTWSVWPYYAVTRQSTGTTSQVVYVNGNLGSGAGSDAGTSTVTANQGTPGASAWPVKDLAAESSLGALVDAGATASNQVLQLAQETSTADTLALAVTTPGDGLYTRQGTTPWTTLGPLVTPVITTGALEASHLLKASSGTHFSTQVQIDQSAPTATYYVQMIQGSATCPANGSVTFLHTPQAVLHTSGYNDNVVFSDSPEGASFTTGLCVELSTTRFTLTAAGAYMAVDANVQ